MSRPVRINSKLLLLLLVIISLWGIYVFVLPEMQLADFKRRFPERKILPSEFALSWNVRTTVRTCEFLGFGWIFYLGASIGSFLNVVAGRVPVGKSIVFGGSKCPYCDTKLAFVDNTPILGWLLLNGKCRTCRLPIAIRYFAIEVLLGGIFLAIALWQLVSAGANLPRYDTALQPGFALTVFYPKWNLIAGTLVHAALFAFLVMLGFASSLRRSFPPGAVIAIVIANAIPIVINPDLCFVKWTEPFWVGGLKVVGRNGNALLSVLIGFAIGTLLGGLSSTLVLKWESCVVRWHWTVQSMLIGTVLGWQAVCLIVLVAAIGQALTRAIRVHDSDEYQFPPWTSQMGLLWPNVWLVGACILHHAFWRQITEWLAIIPTSLLR